MVLDTGGSHAVLAIVFHLDGKHLLSGGGDGIRRWRLVDGQEVGKQTGMELLAISASKDHKWVVCGTDEGASVIHEKIFEVEGRRRVYAVDVSPDSTRFATGTGYPSHEVSFWTITSGESLVGPLKHDELVTGVRFSPNGERIAGQGGSVRVFNALNGDQLIDIDTITRSALPITSLAWSTNFYHIGRLQNQTFRCLHRIPARRIADPQL